MTAGLDRYVVGTPGSLQASLGDLRTGFKNGYIFSLVDIRDSVAPIEVHVLILNPTQYTLSEPFVSTLTPAEDDSVVSEENGSIIREITLVGTTGLRKKAASGFQGAQGGGAPLSGPDHFIALRRMFRSYSELKKSSNDAPFIRMFFHSLREDDHFVVIPRSFETPRDARSTRMHYEYRISLAVIGTADTLDLRMVPQSTDVLSMVSNAMAAIVAPFNDARAFFTDVNAKIALIKRKVGNIQAVMTSVAGMLNAFGNALKMSASVVTYPFQLAVTVLDQVDAAADDLVTSALGVTQADEEIAHSLRRMRASLDKIAQFPQLFDFGSSKTKTVTRVYSGEQTLTSDDMDNGTAGATPGSRTRRALGTQTSINLGDYKGVLRVALDSTMSIGSLATRYNVTKELIILINDLRFPYIAKGGGPGILKPGDSILIPTQAGMGISSITVTAPGGGYLTPEDALYGIDLALDMDVLAKEGRFEIKEDTTRDLLDAQVVRGIPNVIQGTEISIRTEAGSTTFLPDIGIRRSVGIRGTLQNMLLASVYLREAILLDPRVESIKDSRIVLEDDVLTQEISPVLRGQREGVVLILPFGKASSGS
jgi:hypothetical protein